MSVKKKTTKKPLKASALKLDPTVVNLVVSIIMKIVANPQIISDILTIFKKRGVTTSDIEKNLAILLAKQAADIDEL